MNEITIFNNEEFGQIRTLVINNEIWFVGKDVTTVLGYSNPRDAINRYVDYEDKGVEKLDTLGGKQSMTVVNESGLYSLVLSSKMPNARNFKHWVTSEILPTIRKNGAYMTEQTIEKVLTSPDFLIQLATRLKKEQEARKQAEQIVKEQKPKVELFNTMLSSDTSISVGEFAKMTYSKFKLGTNNMFKTLRNNGFLMKNNTPYQKYIDAGYFKVIEVAVNISGGVKMIPKTLVTPKGQEYLFKKLCLINNSLVC